jgi:hypothetical protein
LSSLIAQNSRENTKFYNLKATAIASNGCEQALGHEL